MPRNVPTSAAATLSPDLLRRAAQRAHGDDHAQHRGHDAQAGQRIRHGGQRADRLGRLVVVDFHIQFHHLVHVEGSTPPVMAMRNVSQTKSQA